MKQTNITSVDFNEIMVNSQDRENFILGGIAEIDLVRKMADVNNAKNIIDYCNAREQALRLKLYEAGRAFRAASYLRMISEGDFLLEEAVAMAEFVKSPENQDGFINFLAKRHPEYLQDVLRKKFGMDVVKVEEHRVIGEIILDQDMEGSFSTDIIYDISF